MSATAEKRVPQTETLRRCAGRVKAAAQVLDESFGGAGQLGYVLSCDLWGDENQGLRAYAAAIIELADARDELDEAERIAKWNAERTEAKANAKKEIES